MAGKKSAYLRSEVVKAAVGEDTFPTISTVYLALFEDDPTVDDTGTEVSGGSYARQSVTWAAESGGAIANSAAINFSSMPATTLTHWAVYDAATGGNLLYFGQFDVPIELNATDPFDIDAGNLQISEV